MITSLRSAFSGASRHISGVLVGVLLAPVLPDVAVEVFGGGPAWGDAVLRIIALVVVVAVCVAVYQTQVWFARRRQAVILTGVGRRDVLVLPVGFRCQYRPGPQRTGQRTIPEWLIDTCRPAAVVLVTSPEIGDVEAKLGKGLATEGIRYAVVQLTDVYNPDSAIPEAERGVSAKLGDMELTGLPTYVDTTAGNVVMSLAMLRVARALGAECTYVASRYQHKTLVPGSQSGRAFDPTRLFGTAT